ncbi:MAG: NADPH:quinone oxidoreductase [Candidatus Rokuibacteriota bacterium]|nr:MAG: NADPH:quinone oxidoreductase [Candidatus Rokubacteria bacterium]
MTGRMRAQVLHEWGGEVRYETVAMPSAAPGEALIEVEACSVGLTVLNYMSGNHNRRPEDLPRIPGHEVVGRVIAVGDAVTTPRVGERVITHFYLFCGACDFCNLGHEPLCRNLAGQVGVARDGGYAEYVALPARNFIPVPDGVSPVNATAIPDAIATPLHVCRRAAVAPSDTVIVIGAAGGVGIHMVQMARLFGATVIGIDRGDERLKLVREMGAVAAFDSLAPDVARSVRDSAPRGVTVAVDLVGTPATLRLSLDALAPRGRLVVLTTFPGLTIDVAPREMVARELAILGSRYASRWELAEAARLVAEQRITPVVTEVVTLPEVASLHARLRAGRLLGRGAVVPAGTAGAR